MARIVFRIGLFVGLRNEPRDAPRRALAAAFGPLVLAASLLLAQPAAAGQTCEEKDVTPHAMTSALSLAQDVQATLDGAGAQVALLARIGSDVSKHGLRWTHAGLAYRPDAAAPWTVLHKLNHCGAADSALFEQGLANFFLDDPHEYRALVLLPTPDAQARLLGAVRDGGSTEAVNQPNYSVLAYPFGREYQNSNGWLLEFMAEALASHPVRGRRAAQDHLRETGYRPDFIEVGALERFGATFFKANVAFFDHPLEERLRGRYSIVTVESIVRWLGERGAVERTRELALRDASP